MQAAPDEAIFARAQYEERVIVSADTDFSIAEDLVAGCIVVVERNRARVRDLPIP